MIVFAVYVFLENDVIMWQLSTNDLFSLEPLRNSIAITEQFTISLNYSRSFGIQDVLNWFRRISNAYSGVQGLDTTVEYQQQQLMFLSRIT